MFQKISVMFSPHVSSESSEFELFVEIHSNLLDIPFKLKMRKESKAPEKGWSDKKNSSKILKAKQLFFSRAFRFSLVHIYSCSCTSMWKCVYFIYFLLLNAKRRKCFVFQNGKGDYHHLVKRCWVKKTYKLTRRVEKNKNMFHYFTKWRAILFPSFLTCVERIM